MCSQLSCSLLAGTNTIKVKDEVCVLVSVMCPFYHLPPRYKYTDRHCDGRLCTLSFE